MSIRNDQEMRALCIEGKLTNKELAEHFGVALTEIHAWRSRHGLTIDKCAAIRTGGIIDGKRSAESIKVEILKVQKAKRDAEKKAKRAEDRLKVLLGELKESMS